MMMMMMIMMMMMMMMMTNRTASQTKEHAAVCNSHLVASVKAFAALLLRYCIAEPNINQCLIHEGVA